jgi:hypothetical protein
MKRNDLGRANILRIEMESKKMKILMRSLTCEDALIRALHLLMTCVCSLC